MKKLNFITTLFVIFVFTVISVSAADKPPTKGTITMPENIKSIIDKSCFGCHNTDSQNEDAKEDLDFNTLDELSKIKKISALKEIGETVKEGEMPPKRFLERNPDKKVTEEEIKLLTEWVKTESEALVKQ